MRRRRALRGFGTIEVVVALSLFSFVLVAIIGLLMGSISVGATAEGFSIASNLARQRAAQLADDISQRGAPGTYPATVTVGGRQYTYTTAVTAGNPANVRVEVSFQVSIGSACTTDAAGNERCTGATQTYSRIVETRAWRP
ncbi:MAG: hypothetical protein QN131_12100 [Armatimonadota bacterium]|nr:hypothetical protein [Armatimonadota bacterium]MDR7550659.1 hypothetical protein [Armatimonadota bacterium]